MQVYLPIVVALVTSYELLVYFRAYLNAFIDRNKYSSYQEMLDRALQEHRLNLYAINHLFGTKLKTFLIKSFVVLCLLALLWLAKLVPIAAVMLLTYWSSGFYLTRNSVPNTSLNNRLTYQHRLLYKSGVALLWPLNLQRH